MPSGLFTGAVRCAFVASTRDDDEMEAIRPSRLVQDGAHNSPVAIFGDSTSRCYAIKLRTVRRWPVYVYSFAGGKVAEILTDAFTVLSDPNHHKKEILVLQCGINDVVEFGEANPAATGEDVTDFIDTVEEMFLLFIESCRRLNYVRKFVISQLLPYTPKNPEYPRTAAQFIESVVRDLNRRLERLCKTNQIRFFKTDFVSADDMDYRGLHLRYVAPVKANENQPLRPRWIVTNCLRTVLKKLVDPMPHKLVPYIVNIDPVT